MTYLTRSFPVGQWVEYATGVWTLVGSIPNQHSDSFFTRLDEPHIWLKQYSVCGENRTKNKFYVMVIITMTFCTQVICYDHCATGRSWSVISEELESVRRQILVCLIRPYSCIWRRIDHGPKNVVFNYRHLRKPGQTSSSASREWGIIGEDVYDTRLLP